MDYEPKMKALETRFENSEREKVILNLNKWTRLKYYHLILKINLMCD